MKNPFFILFLSRYSLIRIGCCAWPLMLMRCIDFFEKLYSTSLEGGGTKYLSLISKYQFKNYNLSGYANLCRWCSRRIFSTISKRTQAHIFFTKILRYFWNITIPWIRWGLVCSKLFNTSSIIVFAAEQKIVTNIKNVDLKAMVCII